MNVRDETDKKIPANEEIKNLVEIWGKSWLSASFALVFIFHMNAAFVLVWSLPSCSHDPLTF